MQSRNIQSKIIRQAIHRITGESVMEKLSLLGICVIALVSALINASDPFAMGLLNTVFIISCGVMGVLLLRKADLCQNLIARKKGSRRFDRPVDFPLTDSRGVTLIQDRRRLADRREIIIGSDDQKSILTKKASN
jgi:hypothetical protein